MKKSLLVILDGWGLGKVPKADALAQAETPFFDSLIANYPHAQLVTYGMEVGLPEGQMGNSEVGHLNIGAGRIVYQELARINKALQEDTLRTEKVIEEAISKAKRDNKTLHIMGLLSDGGVHSHINHLIALANIAGDAKLPEIKIHAFLDGRDTDPHAGVNYIHEFNSAVASKGIFISTVIGRYYAMDRDKRWERVKKAYDLLVNGMGERTTDIEAAVKAKYAEGISDEFMEAFVIDDTAKIKEGDVVIFANFRTDRPRQLTEVLTQSDNKEYNMHALSLHYVTMTEYDETYKNVEVVYTKDKLAKTIGEVVADAGLSQLRIAETEKYPHVTFFFSGGREELFEKEYRKLIPSPKVATYDLQPEMSAEGITEGAIESIENEQPDFICLNYANTDMVGHTGIFKAGMIAAETVDRCLKYLVKSALKQDYEIIVIADHGNSDYMINDDGSPNTAHTTNPVPIIYISQNAKGAVIRNGKLADVAPTLLSLMNIAPPQEMTGEVLVSF